MSKKILLVILFCIPTFSKALIGELMLGAAGAAVVKVAASPTGKAARWAATGYLLNTPAGKKLTSLGFTKIRQVVANRFFPAQIENGALRTGAAGIVQGSYNLLRYCGQSSIQLFHSLPKNMAEFRAFFAAMTLRNPFVKVTQFHAHESSTTAFQGATARRVPVQFVDMKNRFDQAFGYRKASYGASTTFNAQNHYTVHQAQGLFPRVNNYYGDAGRSKFWKGFAAGSFASWTTAWYFGNKKEEFKNKSTTEVNVTPVVVGDLKKS